MTDERALYIWDRLNEIERCVDLRCNIDAAVFHGIKAAQSALNITKDEAGTALDPVAVQARRKAYNATLGDHK